MKKSIISIALFLITAIGFAQQIGDGFAPFYITDFSGVLKSGTYGGYGQIAGKVPDVSNDWNHLFVIRHGNENNNYQLQIASSFSENDRLFFRKIAATGLLSRNSTWIELATRGANEFTGKQQINGFVKIQSANSNYDENLRLLPSTTGDYSSIALGAVAGDSGTGIGQWTIVRYPAISNYMFSLRYNSTDYFNILNNGNIGIGITNPKNKLDVNGSIHSQEVKVDMLGWSDFVFKKEYNLPSLTEVEKHIAEKGHLANIPSEEEVLKNGINLGEMNAKLLQKIEELTLYMIEIKKENTEMKNKQVELENTVRELNSKLK
ncbi:hypothetical protein [Flavobacterium chilense]|uniref:Cell wall anchor protein n=1 Tax=Flavobacterium chilense TaxID=946677 RepID=A0A1M7AWM6_9FLAO|nr:hypothetical protein [Flavobacterium chilense]SHL46819.1 hypothetical protein SAMN05444484_1011585 [Flavobacterium chilense]